MVFLKTILCFLILVQAFYLFTSVLVNLCSLVSVVGEQFLFFDFCTSIFLSSIVVGERFF